MQGRELALWVMRAPRNWTSQQWEFLDAGKTLFASESVLTSLLKHMEQTDGYGEANLPQDPLCRAIPDGQHRVQRRKSQSFVKDASKIELA